MMANLRPVLWRGVLLGGCALILAFVLQAVWRDVPYAGEAVLLLLPALAAWVVGLFLLPGPKLSFHVEINDAACCCAGWRGACPAMRRRCSWRRSRYACPRWSPTRAR